MTSKCLIINAYIICIIINISYVSDFLSSENSSSRRKSKFDWDNFPESPKQPRKVRVDPPKIVPNSPNGQSPPPPASPTRQKSLLDVLWSTLDLEYWLTSHFWHLYLWIAWMTWTVSKLSPRDLFKRVTISVLLVYSRYIINDIFFTLFYILYIGYCMPSCCVLMCMPKFKSQCDHVVISSYLFKRFCMWICAPIEQCRTACDAGFMNAVKYI